MLSPLRETVESLQEQVWQAETSRRPRSRAENAGGWLDQLLPAGVRRGTLLELLAIPGGGATSLALIAAREICREEAVVVVDPAGRFFPPAAVNRAATVRERGESLPDGRGSQASGSDLEHLMIVRPRSRADYLWTLNQALRSRGVGAVLSWPEKLDARAVPHAATSGRGGRDAGTVRPPSRRARPAKLVGSAIASRAAAQSACAYSLKWCAL